MIPNDTFIVKPRELMLHLSSDGTAWFLTDALGRSCRNWIILRFFVYISFKISCALGNMWSRGLRSKDNIRSLHTVL